MLGSFRCQTLESHDESQQKLARFAPGEEDVAMPPGFVVEGVWMYSLVLLVGSSTAEVCEVLAFLAEELGELEKCVHAGY